ncbi:hypothetical protein F5X68DRAFT_152999 [Plectosphaerella plurivora]|uniref:NAD(P)-binding protein n=1 Tax=Plectosphaerella plurivora TaxID=936078 RepID=A0A9P9ACT7_9PEZI|nr:hypothetical protein F5X68DRAFT_152999 [Plectosphaerella plurivora]
MSSETTAKVAIVTGASSGLGRAIACKYAVQGWSVLCSDLYPSPPAGESLSTVDLINGTGNGAAAFFCADVSRSQDVQDMINEAVRLYGRLDVLVNNAGVSFESYDKLGPKPITDTDDDVFDKTIAINTRSVFLGCKYAIRQFLRQDPGPSGSRGWIINTASVFGLKAEVGHVSYCTSKAAVIHLTKCIAREQGPNKIHCNAICPGFIKTAMDDKMLSNADQASVITALHPWGSLGTTEDIAKSALFLATEESCWMTGVALPVDGGYSIA